MPRTADLRARLADLVLALVLLNLVFVHITNAVAMRWLVPLYALTLLSPWLRRFAARTSYHLAWNLVVIGIFIALVRDAMTEGVRYLLEDGLILAAFCQVHLLNNLGPRQKPDLLFFNSFLIALVTSFFVQDLHYSVVFLVYAGVLLVAIEAHRIVERAGDGVLPHLGEVARDASGRVATVLVTTFALFLVLPRDFERQGLLGDQLLQAPVVQRVGFSEQVKLGRSGTTLLSDKTVLRAKLLNGPRHHVTGYWRGATLATLTHDGWRRWGSPREVHAWVQSRHDTWVRDRRGAGDGGDARQAGAAETVVRVTIDDRSVLHAFLDPAATRMRLLPPGDPGLMLPLADGTLRYHRQAEASPGELRYEISIEPRRANHSALRRAPPSPRSMPFLQLDTAAVPESAAALAAELERRIPASQPQVTVVDAIADHLSSSFGYLLPGEQGAARNLDEFLRGAPGHCEYFASAMAILLRLRGIPCRLVTGYRSGEWDESGSEMIVRRRDAHAWLEVHDPAGFWYTVDPSPAADGDGAGASSWVASLTASLRALWDDVTRFDGKRRDAVLGWLGSRVEDVATALHEAPLRSGGLAGLIAGWWLVRRRRRRSAPAAVRDYIATLRRLRIERGATETPRQVLSRCAPDLAQGQRAALAAATARHELARYTGPPQMAGCDGFRTTR